MSHAAIILAAGYGSLRGPNGRSLPKLLEPVGDQPMIVRVVHAALAARLTPCVIVLNARYGPAIRDELDKHFDASALILATQQDRYGSGDAALQGARALPEYCGDATVLCGDMPLWKPETIQRLSDLHRASTTPMTMATYEFTPAEADWFAKFGRVLKNSAGQIEGVREASDFQAPWQLRSFRRVNPALMVFRRTWLLANLPRLTPHDRDDAYPAETYLPELVQFACSDGGVTELLLSDPVELLGVNTLQELERVQQYAAGSQELKGGAA